MASYFWTATASNDPAAGANWTKSDGTTGTAPGTGDDAFIQAIPGVALANIDPADMSAVTLNSLTISQTYRGTIGSTSTAGASFFGYWKIGATTWTIGAAGGAGGSGAGAAGGSGRIKLDFGTAPFAGTVLDSGNSVDAGYEPVRIKGTHATNKLTVLGGSVGVASNLPAETSQLATANVVGGQSSLHLGYGTTYAVASASGGGTLVADIGTTGTISASGGSSATVRGPNKVGTVTSAGTVSLLNRPASGNLADVVSILRDGVLDCSGDPTEGTIGTMNLYAGCRFSTSPVNPGHITVTTLVKVDGGNLSLAA